MEVVPDLTTQVNLSAVWLATVCALLATPRALVASVEALSHLDLFWLTVVDTPSAVCLIWEILEVIDLILLVWPSTVVLTLPIVVVLLSTVFTVLLYLSDRVVTTVSKSSGAGVQSVGLLPNSNLIFFMLIVAVFCRVKNAITDTFVAFVQVKNTVNNFHVVESMFIVLRTTWFPSSFISNRALEVALA